MRDFWAWYRRHPLLANAVLAVGILTMSLLTGGRQLPAAVLALLLVISGSVSQRDLDSP